MSKAVLQSILTCALFGRTSTETMLRDACQFFWRYPSRNEVLRPKSGDFCVFCSYGTAPCPPIQAGDGCCS